MIAGDLQDVAERLARVTVQIRNRRESVGCGIIWSPGGLIMSNAHVARENSVMVELADGTLLDGRVRWRHRRHDLAAIEVAATGLPAAELLDPKQLRAGQIVVALGHPFGLPNALALGLLHRSTGEGDAEWLRADIRLAPGNSGGPLATATGKIIGLNTLIAGGLAYAIPASRVQHCLAEIGARAA
jgi:serine protease Do